MRVRFQLRTLLVFVVLACVPIGWVTYQLDWIRQRHRFLQKHPLVDYNELRAPGDDRMPWSLKVLREPEQWVLVVPQADHDQAVRLFPEARVCAILTDGTRHSEGEK